MSLHWQTASKNKYTISVNENVISFNKQPGTDAQLAYELSKLVQTDISFWFVIRVHQQVCARNIRRSDDNDGY